MMKEVYLDSDVIIDFLYGREPFFIDSIEIISLIEEKKIKGYISSLIIWNLFYILSKQLNSKKARELIKDFKNLIHIISVDEKIIDFGLNSTIKDFEDSIQYFCARTKDIEYFITRNKKDYPKEGIKVVTPKEFLTLWKV
ncbi:type II toxin-antitoxin system VapC family toxin [Leptospira sp. GIMC2001]|uniref:type II toxin-antitoxin system VapC family toxin n=1 Tax=Leptospira sp. GIMC2001 TaxID=1513297 RepID=UPI00234AB1C7|nr:PIN domain-containing protein [Leptospira sp. GIMC2001]WCL50638.1 PIN domain-containing protein [Leptospira sp. GIMC2001]WCL50674.1 PIN domain-containing protein [Leptospira sp. GIMC2001]